MRRWVAVAVAAVALVSALPGAAARTRERDHDRAVAPAPGPRIEPSVAVNPRRPSEVLVTLMRMRTTYQTGFGQVGVPDVELHLSTDGGRRFTRTGIVPRPKDTNYTGDPSVAFDSRGRAYVSYLASARNTEAGLFMVRSDDGGHTWPTTATRVAREIIGEDGCVGHDKPYVAVGPPPGRRRGLPDAVYVTWHTNTYADPECTQPTAPNIRPMFARSTDGGRTFSPPVELSDQMSFAAIPAVAPDGTLRVVYLGSGTRSCPQSYPSEVRVMTSRDGGQSFTEHVATEVCFALPGTPTGGLYYANSLPTIAINPRTGSVTVASVHRDAVTDAVVVAGSDRGGPWAPRAAIPRPPGILQELPWLAYAPSGKLAAAYLGQAPGGVYDAYLAWSADDGRTWSEPAKLTSTPSLGNVRSFADAWSLGHYLGLAVGRDDVAHPVWPDIRPGEPTMVNIWTRPVPLR